MLGAVGWGAVGCGEEVLRCGRGALWGEGRYVKLDNGVSVCHESYIVQK